MNEKKDVPYIVFESSLAREERHSNRLIILIIILMCGWMTTIGLFMWYISLPVDETVTTQTVDDIDGSTINQVGGDNYGESDTDHD